MTGYDGADRQIEAYQHTIRAMGEAGIPILGYNFMPNSVWRTSRTAPGRGGVEVTAFDMAAVEASDTDGREFMPDRPDWASGLFATSDPDEVLDADTMWANYERFMHAVLPVARDAGVKLALHPDDPLHRLPARRPRAPHGRRHAVEPPCPCACCRLHAGAAQHDRPHRSGKRRSGCSSMRLIRPISRTLCSVDKTSSCR